jgi:DNA adenine methylase
MTIRPPFAYFGGKARLAAWITGHFPPHRTFVDLFGGAANIALNKTPAFLDVYNDRDGDLVNFFRVLREQPGDLIRAIELTPYARAEFEQAREDLGVDPLERARRFYVLIKQSNFPGRVSGRSWRVAPQTNTTMVTNWRSNKHLWTVADRLLDWQIENLDALEALKRYDSPETLFYADPPYLQETRRKNAHGYRCEFDTPEQHQVLAGALNEIEGMALISGYDSALYRTWLADWRRVTETQQDATTQARTECLWISPRAWHALDRPRQMALFR